MIDEDNGGRVMLVDFNIASPAYRPWRTRSGTPAYLAPDAGRDGWEPSDDLFACGVVLYELMLGEHPFPASQPIAGVSPRDPRELRPRLRPSLAALLMRGCSPTRADRYRTAAAMRQDLVAEHEHLLGWERRLRLALQRWIAGRGTGMPQAPREPLNQPDNAADVPMPGHTVAEELEMLLHEANDLAREPTGERPLAVDEEEPDQADQDVPADDRREPPGRRRWR